MWPDIAHFYAMQPTLCSANCSRDPANGKGRFRASVTFLSSAPAFVQRHFSLHNYRRNRRADEHFRTCRSLSSTIVSDCTLGRFATPSLWHITASFVSFTMGKQMQFAPLRNENSCQQPLRIKMHTRYPRNIAHSNARNEFDHYLFC